MNTTLSRALAAGVAILVIIGFGFLYGHAVYRCWKEMPDKPPKFDDAYIYVATALAGLIGGVVAMIFNEKLPDAPDARPNPSLGSATPSATGPEATLTALRGSFLGTRADFLTIVSVSYVFVYFATCVCAIVTWIIFPKDVPDLIKNLALIGIGLFIAIARSFFSVPPPR